MLRSGGKQFIELLFLKVPEREKHPADACGVLRGMDAFRDEAAGDLAVFDVCDGVNGEVMGPGFGQAIALLQCAGDELKERGKRALDSHADQREGFGERTVDSGLPAEIMDAAAGFRRAHRGNITFADPEGAEKSAKKCWMRIGFPATAGLFKDGFREKCQRPLIVALGRGLDVEPGEVPDERINIQPPALEIFPAEAAAKTAEPERVGPLKQGMLLLELPQLAAERGHGCHEGDYVRIQNRAENHFHRAL